MTENEAIKRIRYRIDTATYIAGKGSDGKAYEDMEISIKALEEIQQYRTIGTVEELSDMKKDYAEAISDWRQYRKIGTVEECRAAVEKQRAKKPIMKTDDGIESISGLNPYCPSCGCELTDRIPFDNKDFYFHCLNCGQKLDWIDTTWPIR